MQASPQGIAALNPMMGRNIPQPPQMPPQMPQGMGPSRAGLGTVQDRVDMYRANPAALQQQYAVSQDMLDLLALQQIKSEKEAAMRNMQLQMAQQSGQQPTVAQQREQEVMEMTKQDLAQQVGAVGQQQEQQRQQALQELMSGIAQAPGAANVMPMAGGGIIAFQDRGEVPDDTVEYLRSRGVPEKYIRDRQASGMPTGAIESNAKMDFPELFAAQTSAVGEFSVPERFKDTREIPMPAAPLAPARAAQMPPPPAAPAMPMRMPEPQVQAQQPAQQPPVQQAPAQGIAAIAPPDLRQRVTETTIGQLGRDPAAEERARREEAEAYMRDALAKQRAVREQGIASERERMQQEYDPERLRRERLKAFLLGPPGHDLASTLAGGAQGSMAYMQQQAAQQRARQQALQKSEEELAGLDVTQRGKYFDAGSAARTAAETARREGLERGVSLVTEESRASTAAADRRSREIVEEARRKAEAERPGSTSDYDRIYKIELGALRARGAPDTPETHQKASDEALRKLRGAQDIRAKTMQRTAANNEFGNRVMRDDRLRGLKGQARIDMVNKIREEIEEEYGIYPSMPDPLSGTAAPAPAPTSPTPSSAAPTRLKFDSAGKEIK